jgi:hypothetical protein
VKYVPILQELFESNTVILLIFGIVIAAIMCLYLKKKRSLEFALITSIVVYVVCELMSNIRTNFMIEIILLFVGTIALGCCIVFLISLLIKILLEARRT